MARRRCQSHATDFGPERHPPVHHSLDWGPTVWGLQSGAYSLRAYSLRAYSLGGYNLRLPILEPDTHSLDWGLQPWCPQPGAYSLGAYSLTLQMLEPDTRSQSGGLQFHATDSGARHALTVLGSYSLEAYCRESYGLGLHSGALQSHALVCILVSGLVLCSLDLYFGCLDL